MRHFAVNENYFERDFSTFSLEYKSRKPSLTKGDLCLVYERLPTDLIFVRSGEIVGVSEDDHERRIKYDFKSSETLKHKSQLSELAYSLDKVYRFSKPGVHFRAPYSTLSTNDFKTISDNVIFWSRTYFGLFVGTIPREAFDEFTKGLIEKNIDVYRKNDFHTLWHHLQEYINEKYLSTQTLLLSIKNMTDSMEIDQLNFESTYLEEGNVRLSLSGKLDELNAFKKFWMEATEGAQELIDKNELESDHRFRGASFQNWPIESAG